VRLRTAIRAFASAGNASFLKPGDWSTFMQYEQTLNASLNGHRILTLCSYARPQFDDRQFSEVMRAHHCAFEGPDVHGQVVAVPQSPKMRDLPMKKEEPMADRGTQSTQVSETMHCPDCHSKMNWYRSMQVGDEAPATVTHFFQCPDCNRVQEKRVQADINGVPSDPVLPLTAR
jgi:DNA-directed RNA polymerase subunit M/transcription elongation factor TFIIS